MNPLIKKEIRLLLPNAIICCALGLANFLFSFNNNSSFQNLWGFLLAFVFCGAMAVMLALNSFGAEISSGTFTNLLAQPISRQKIWEAKILVQAVSLLAVGIFWSACGIIRLQLAGHAFNLPDLFTGVGAFGLVAFSGGLWTVLLLRQIAAAFWFTVLVPTVIWVTLLGLFAGQSDEFVKAIVVGVLGAYSLVGFFFARWLFFRAQDLQWSGGTVVLSEMRGLARLKSSASVRRVWRPHAALWWKEIQLHQSQFIIALGFLVLHLGILATRNMGHFEENSTTEFILENFWMLWLVMPLLVGCAAAAEERGLGTYESQLCLPVKRRTQFSVKLSVVLLISLLLGAVMPLLLEGTRVLPDAHIRLVDAFKAQFGGNMPLMQDLSQNIFWTCIVQINHLMPLLTFVGIVTGITAVSFHASTLARNTLQTLGPAVVGLILFSFLMTVVQSQKFAGHPLWRGELIYFIGLPAALLVLLALAFWNFRHPVTNWQLWLRNLLALATSLALVVVATAAIYHRAWQKLTPFEPIHGPARLALANPATLSEHENKISVRLPDGRIWIAHFMPWSFPSNPVAFALGKFKVAADSGNLLAGSDWTMVEYIQGWLVGVKTNGTLWISERSRRANGSHTADLNTDQEEMGHFVQFGDETNWAGFFENGPFTTLRKMDGSIWEFNSWDTDRTTLRISRVLTPPAVAHLRHDKFPSPVTISSWGFAAGIQDDGTFRIWDDQNFNLRQMGWGGTNLTIGHGTNWLALAGEKGGRLPVADWMRKLVTLKDDGTLWLWDLPWGPTSPWNPRNEARMMQNTTPVRLGTHSDWISLCNAECGVISLAADGSLWFWPLERPIYLYNYDHQFEPLLDMPHKPVYLGNIFSAQ